MTNREKLFKMLGFPVCLKINPVIRVVKTDKTKKKAAKDDQ